MWTAFWNSEGLVLADFFKKGTTVNSGHYIDTLIKCKHLKEESEGLGYKINTSSALQRQGSQKWNDKD